MSPQLMSILIILVLGVAGCRPGPYSVVPEAQLDIFFESPASNPSKYIDGEALPPAEPHSKMVGTFDEQAIIQQAMAADYAPSGNATAAGEEALIRQAIAAQDAMTYDNLAPPLHRASHVRDVEMHETRQHQPYLLDSGDRIRLFVYGQPNLSRTYSVDDGGFISVPLIGTVRARNLTTHALERSIGDLLAADYVRDPRVSIEISQHRPFFILGEVRRAGQYPFVSAMTVQTAVAIAGGFSDRAHEKSVKLTRTVNGYRTIVEVAPLEPVYPGDTIHVRERFF